MYVAVPEDRDPEPVRIFSTFTEDREALADWLLACGITTAAMESSGVYWIPRYQILEDRGIKVCLTSARQMRNVPGRRTDWQECQWLQYLHSVGLLRAAFRPQQQVCATRSLMRHRGRLVESACDQIRLMQKSLTQMNVQRHHVISDLTGVTGMAIVDAILGGERDATRLARLRRPEVRATQETIRKSLEGDGSAEHLFTLKQARELYGTIRGAIEECDREIEGTLGEFEPRVDPDEQPPPPGRKKRKTRRAKRTGDFRFDTRREAYRLFGVDVTEIPGLGGNALTLFSEVGRDMNRWASADQFVSWLALCADFKGWFLAGNGERCEPLTLLDAWSRYLLRCQLLSGTGYGQVKAVMEAAFREYGLPRALRTDNGPPFATLAVGGLSRLAVWWVKLGIIPERIDPGKPQQNGRLERLHQTLKREAASPPARTWRQQQEALRRFQKEYNEQRPHEALGQQTPASC